MKINVKYIESKEILKRFGNNFFTNEAIKLIRSL